MGIESVRAVSVSTAGYCALLSKIYVEVHLEKSIHIDQGISSAALHSAQLVPRGVVDRTEEMWGQIA